MHWTVSAATLLHLLFCALIVAACFVCTLVANDNSELRTDYNRFESKYFGENETYNNDKRQIIEDFYRQSSLAAKSIQEMSFHLNRTGAVKVFEVDDDANRNFSTQTYNEGNKLLFHEKSRKIPHGKSLSYFKCVLEIMKWKIYVGNELASQYTLNRRH